MVKKTTRPSRTSVSRRDSGGGGGDSLFFSLFHASNRHSLFVGIFIGMSVMGIFVRLRESTDFNNLNELMATTISSNVVPASDIIDSPLKMEAASLRHGTKPKQPKRQHPQFDPSWDVFQRIEAEQTGRVRAPKSTDADVDRAMSFINFNQIEENDAFSASWLQKRESFLTMHLDEMGICEDGAFFAYMRDDREKNTRLSADWLDFSVEHLSKWYNMMNIMSNDVPLHNAIQKLEAYLERGSTYPVPLDPFLDETIAVISFQAFQDKDKPDKAKAITIPTLAATIESLRRAGFGRCVVSGVEETDKQLAIDAFNLVHKLIQDQSEIAGFGVKRVGHMEVEFARGHMGHAKTQYHDMNIPRATLMGLREAFRIQERGDNDHDSIVNMRTWLGDHKLNHWKYVYLTEPDSILATRPSTLKTIQRYVEEGTVLIPWRLQPIPHESDLQGCKATNLYVKAQGDFKDVLELDALNEEHPDKCCDEFRGPDYKPGRPPQFPECENFWYMCGFMPGEEHNPDANARLKPYTLIRLKHGTQLVHLSSHEHGRRCRPVKSQNKDICEPPEQK